MVYFAMDVATKQYIMPYTVPATIMMQLTAEINIQIESLKIVGTVVSFTTIFLKRFTSYATSL